MSKIIYGLFGPIYHKYERKGQLAVAYLLRKREGEVLNALYHPEIGWIDLVWGFEGTGNGDGFGLSKIAKYHPSVVHKLAETLESMAVVKRTENRIKLESAKYIVVISNLYFENKKTWLLTAFEKRNPAGR